MNDEEKKTDQATDLVAITNLIQNYLSQIEKDKEELKTSRQMLSDSFENDSTYKLRSDKVKEATKIRNATKAQILKQPALMELKEKVKEISDKIKEANQSISDYLQQYRQLSGLDSFETADGQVAQIVYTARLVKVGGEK